MSNAIFSLPESVNEPINPYAPGTRERALLKAELERQYHLELDIPLIIGGQEVRTGKTQKAVCPHDHGHVLARFHEAGEAEVRMAIDAAMAAKKAWEATPWEDRAAIFHKMGSLISSKYRYILNAATMLNQSKSAFQAEIDSTCETADFLRFNAGFMEQIYRQQPISDPHVWNRVHYRALEGFVFAVTPFNFTAIAANLPTAPAIMGNTVVWKPASTSILSNYYLMQLYKEAGLPDGVINFVPGRGSMIGKVALEDRNFAGLHFTGSTGVFNSMWKTISGNLERYRSYPRIVGETGGKDYVFMHQSGDVAQTAAAIVRAGFEYQGQKCSACSRVYAPASRWPELKERLLGLLAEIRMGDVRDFRNYFNAVIDEAAFDNTMKYIELARNAKDAEILAGGKGDKSKGWFIEPTLILTTNPKFVSMEEEIFAPVVTIFVYDDAQLDETLKILDETSPYALTGAIFARDRYVINHLTEALANTAGNFYINDKPTGAVVGHQPFGGSRASGTNDKAGSFLNLIRWTSPRTIKESFTPPADIKFPFLEAE
ncbi:1-pyrroline-5-carboxylate dehydrogenase [Geothrix oryzae]|jgi:1-pyrroline-5-carboxylate dehydrogenase|uniref:L-glutamate gamma-semialdehyde dehydrogenase n=1 Tax=Geothrix oryzae TaxID=2927975 RepID=A0ABM8DN33_9BACT|nr:L-glutamate gamma-semialdehyde dehydrogenase [Geothrix oryzae]BDU68302.1 1-pyrroline-5-carboxylate dehydrogenase [Geothrix oryzae]